jgi:hypothetical protein
VLAALREPRTRLVAVYVGLVALAYVIHALPGGIFYRSNAEYPFWLAVDAILIVFIARGSRTATAVPLLLNLLFLTGLFLTATGSDVRAPDLVAFVVVLLAQTAVLVRLLFWRRPTLHLSGAAPAG